MTRKYSNIGLVSTLRAVQACALLCIKQEIHVCRYFGLNDLAPSAAFADIADTRICTGDLANSGLQREDTEQVTSN
jgi:hypothetical protein